jgi:hypothetical protein
MKGKVLSFPFIYFSESGLFNGLQAIQMKKFLPFSTRVVGCSQKVSTHLATAVPPRFALPLPVGQRSQLPVITIPYHILRFFANKLNRKHLAQTMPQRDSPCVNLRLKLRIVQRHGGACRVPSIAQSVNQSLVDPPITI